MHDTPTFDPLVEDYLRDLHAAVQQLPPRDAKDLEGQIRAHLAEALPSGSSPSDADVRQVLQDLGEPDEIVAAALGDLPSKRTVGGREIAAVVLVLVGGVLLPVVGWFVGAALLWSSDAWSRRDKLIATLLFPGGLALPTFLSLFPPALADCELSPAAGRDLLMGACDPGPMGLPGIAGWTALAVAVLVPVAIAVRLLRRAGRAAPVPGTAPFNVSL